MLRLLLHTAALLAGLALLLSACSTATSPISDPTAPAGVVRVAVSPEGSRPEIAVTSVVPWPGEGPWSRSTVILDYSPLTGDVALERASLRVDGRLRPARVTWTALTPVSSVVIFSWRRPLRAGTHTLRAQLGTTGGGSVAYEWTTTAR